MILVTMTMRRVVVICVVMFFVTAARLYAKAAILRRGIRPVDGDGRMFNPELRSQLGFDLLYQQTRIGIRLRQYMQCCERFS